VTIIYEPDEWDALTCALVKACSDNTTANFQRIILDRIIDKWVVRFYLFSESLNDRETISDITTEFFSYGEDYGVFSSIDDICDDEIYIGDNSYKYHDVRATTIFSISNFG
jgi:hypothetical protein